LAGAVFSGGAGNWGSGRDNGPRWPQPLRIRLNAKADAAIAAEVNFMLTNNFLRKIDKV
jgi:hypothetical protein